MKLKIIIGIVVFVLAMLKVNSQPFFYSQSLQNLYYSLPPDCRLSMPVADTVVYCQGIVSDGVVPVAFSSDKYEMMVHIGYRFLHNEEIRKAFNPAIIMFLEREVLALLIADNLKQKLATNRDNGIYLLLNGNTLQTDFYRNKSGLPHLLQQVSGLEIQYMEGREYSVNINCGTEQTLTVMFVADAELLSDMDKKERDERLVAQLNYHCANMDNQSQHIPACNEETMQVIQDSVQIDSAFVCKGVAFIIPQINNNLYYTKVDGEFKLVFSKNRIAETLSNVMLTPIGHDYTVQITHRVYGGIIHNYELNSRDFFDYFSDDYERYFGIETIDRDILTGTLVLADKNADNIHLAHVSVNLWELLNGGVMGMQLSSNIPQHNIESLFGKIKDRDSNNKKYKLNIN
ncbi:MAG: hypothetical protein FWD09_08395 [Lentimicrobiaceae bacterium]|nr:hypothetical protein [Lentimicrobiaceae bacterium]